ncbi:MAG: mechanosensitive ion channel family protein [Nanoarchaeota archaeon]
MDINSIMMAIAELPSAVKFIIIFGLTVIVEHVLRYLVKKSFDKSSKILKVDPSHYIFMKYLVSIVVYLAGIGIAMSFIPSLKTVAISLFASAGVLAVILGFAAQQAFSNIISGIFIAIFKPFKVGDTIKFSNNIGVVEDITLRHTVIRNFENRRFVIPNSKISEETIENFNMTEEKTCRHVEISISYDSSIDKAMKIMRDEAMKHPEFLDNRTAEEKKGGLPPVVVRVLGFGDSSVNLRAWVWAKDPGAAFRMGTDLNKSIKECFDKEGIEIPFPYRTIVYKKDIRKK